MSVLNFPLNPTSLCARLNLQFNLLHRMHFSKTKVVISGACDKCACTPAHSAHFSWSCSKLRDSGKDMPEVFDNYLTASPFPAIFSVLTEYTSLRKPLATEFVIP